MKLLILILTISVSSYSQIREVTYYDINRKEVDSINAVTYIERSFKDKEKVYQKMKHFTIDGKLIELQNFINWEVEHYDTQLYILNGISKKYHVNGVLKDFKFYKADRLDGKLITYYDSGVLKREDLFKSGKFISGKCFDSNGNEIEHFDYINAPIYKGGEEEIHKFLHQNVKIPPRFKRLGISGNALIKFTVLKNGELSNVEVISSSNKVFAKESMRLIKLLKDWIPSKIDGEYTDRSFRLPFTFDIRTKD